MADVAPAGETRALFHLTCLLGCAEIGLREGEGVFEPLSQTPPPLLGSRDGDP